MKYVLELSKDAEILGRVSKRKQNCCWSPSYPLAVSLKEFKWSKGKCIYEGSHSLLLKSSVLVKLWRVSSHFSVVWFISLGNKNVAYGFLMERCLIKIPVHLPRSEVDESHGPSLMTSYCCWGLSSSAGWLTSACTTEPRHYTLTLPTYWQTHTYCFSLGIFWSGLLIPRLSTRSHFSLASSVFPTEVYEQPWPSGQVRVRYFGATCNFLLWDIDVSCTFFPPYFCLVPPSSSLQIRAGAC